MLVFYFTQKKGAWNALQLGHSGGVLQSMLLKNQGQKDLFREDFEASVGYTVRSQPDWTTQ